MATDTFRHPLQESAYSSSQVVPKTQEFLGILFRCQISTFPYENLSVHYSSHHLVNIDPGVLYQKIMSNSTDQRGGYCMELSIFFHHMLRGLGFQVYMTGVRNRSRTNGVPQGEYQGWTHINNIIHLPNGSRFGADVAFGGDGPTAPLPMDGGGYIHRNLGSQEVRLIHDIIPKQQRHGPKAWIYQYRNSAALEWNSFYSFTETEFFQEDFEVMNWWASAKTLHRWTVLCVRFLREGEPIKYPRGDWQGHEASEVNIVGKVMLVNNVVKVNMGGKTQVVHQVNLEDERRQALYDYFGIRLTEGQFQSIEGWYMAL